MPTISDLNAHMGYLLRVASNAVSHEFARKIADEDVTVAQWSLMRVLYDSDPLAPTALADKMGMTKGSISKLAARLLYQSIIACSDNPNDKRAHTLSLTARGHDKQPVLATINSESRQIGN